MIGTSNRPGSACLPIYDVKETKILRILLDLPLLVVVGEYFTGEGQERREEPVRKSSRCIEKDIHRLGLLELQFRSPVSVRLLLL